jgi:hypothetical protein
MKAKITVRATRTFTASPLPGIFSAFFRFEKILSAPRKFLQLIKTQKPNPEKNCSLLVYESGA